jgi:undecaprenyl diphosphate synthase
MDGNGRWAKAHHLPRAMGHQRGDEAVRRLVRGLEPLGVECLTLYAFSSENWKRPEDEIADLMGLMRKFIRSDLPDFVANGVRLKILGDYRVLEPDIVAMLEDALAQTAHGDRTVAVALNYGSQQEIARAAARPRPRERSRPRRSPRTSTPPTSRRSTCWSHLGRGAAVELPAVAGGLCRDVVYRRAVARLHPEHLEEALASFAGRERRYGGR